MAIRNLGFRVTEDRHRRYHLAARLVNRSLTDVIVELLDTWSDEKLRGTSLANLIAVHEESGEEEAK